jgi:uncharacterized protein YbjT (DUF2867 family)
VYVSHKHIRKVRGFLVSSNELSARVAVVAGASGLVGSECLRQLLQSSDYDQVIAMVRRPLETSHPKLFQINVDFSNLPIRSEFAGADVFSALGSTMKQAGSREAFRRVDYDATLSFAKMAAEGGARQFVLVSSIGANSHSATFYLKVKGELEDALRSLPFRALHIFRPSFLAGDRVVSRPADRVGTAVAKAFDFAFVGQLKKYSAVDVTELAAAMLSAARQSEPGTHTYDYEQILSLAQS